MSERVKKFTQESYTVIYPVFEHEDGLRLDQFLMNYLSSFSREMIKKKIRRGDVKILERDHPNKGSVRVKHREKIRVSTQKSHLEDEYWQGKKIEFEDPEIIFEDNDLLIISKPPYMATHPTGRHLFFTAVTYFEEHLKNQIFTTHRLDRETSGCLILAKNTQSASKIVRSFENSKVKKAYFFLAHKKHPQTDLKNFWVHQRLDQEDDFIPRLYVHCYSPSSSQGKKASTYFKTLAQSENYICGLAYPITGRQHQIRAHSAYYGYPLVGDKLYNGDPYIFTRYKDGEMQEDDFLKMILPRHALHSCAIRFPWEEKEHTSIAPLPQDLINLAKSLNFEIEKLSLKEKILQGFEDIKEASTNPEEEM